MPRREVNFTIELVASERRLTPYQQQARAARLARLLDEQIAEREQQGQARLQAPELPERGAA